MQLPNSVYDWLKWFSLTCIPALVVLLSTILPAVGVDSSVTNTIVTVVGAVGIFIGALIGVSTASYNKNDTQ